MRSRNKWVVLGVVYSQRHRRWCHRHGTDKGLDNSQLNSSKLVRANPRGGIRAHSTAAKNQPISTLSFAQGADCSHRPGRYYSAARFHSEANRLGRCLPPRSTVEALGLGFQPERIRTLLFKMAQNLFPRMKKSLKF